MLRRDRIPEMTNLLAKALEVFWSRQGNQVVGDHDKSPVPSAMTAPLCLDALPGAHKHVAEGQVLLDVLVEDLYSKTLAVKSDHLGFAHLEMVGNQEPRFLGAPFGDKQKDGADLGQMDNSLGDLELSLFGNTHGLVSPRSLGQVTDDSLLAVDFQNTIALDRSHESPARFDNRNQDRSTGIPAVHEHGYGSMKILMKRLKNILRQIDLAFERTFETCGLGPVSLNGPSQPLACDLQNTGDSALTLCQSICGVVNSQPFDFFALSGTGGVVDHHQNFFGLAGSLGQDLLVDTLKMRLLLDRAIQKTLQVVGKCFGNLVCDFSCGMKLDEPDQTYQVHQKVFALRFGKNAQEPQKVRRSFLGCFLAHGFHAVLLALHGIGDFGWKPFDLKIPFLLVT